MADVVVHLVTQRGQPYGSWRYACERCGEYSLIAFGGEVGHRWTSDETLYASLPAGYVRCDRAESPA